jgi:DNA-binding CsgD family transcriptional regulator
MSREQQRALLVKYGFEPHGEATWEPVTRLAPRQRETLELYATLGIQKAVAAAMSVSLQTVKNNLADSYKRLGATNAIEAFTKLGWLVVRPEGWSDETLPDGAYWTLRISGEDVYVRDSNAS